MQYRAAAPGKKRFAQRIQCAVFRVKFGVRVGNFACAVCVTAACGGQTHGVCQRICFFVCTGSQRGAGIGGLDGVKRKRLQLALLQLLRSERMCQYRRAAAAMDLGDAIGGRQIAAQKFAGNGPLQKQPQDMAGIGGKLHCRDEQHIRMRGQRRAHVVIGHGDGGKTARFGLGGKLAGCARAVSGRERVDMQIGANDHGFLRFTNN